MLFGACLGKLPDIQRWQAVVQQHADWLGYEIHHEHVSVSNGRVACLTWLWARGTPRKPLVWRCGQCLVAPTAGWSLAPHTVPETQEPGTVLRACTDQNLVAVAWDSTHERLCIALPPFTTEPVLYTESAEPRVFSTDLRLMAAWSGLDLDDAGVFALLQHSVIPAPLSLLRGVQRLPNGHLATCGPESASLNIDVFHPPPSTRDTPIDPADAQKLLNTALDQTLTQVPSNSVLYFSGGVDSGLLAARLAHLGRRDVRLLSFSFGPQDDEARVARQMAAQLNLPLVSVPYDPNQIADLYARLARDYTFVFEDYSTLVTNLLVHASIDLAESAGCVIDGTGADGVFSGALSLPAWQRVYRVPRTLRQIASVAYARLGGWKHSSRKSMRSPEYVGRIMRRSLQFPLTIAALGSFNSLDGVAYHIPPAPRRRIDHALRLSENATTSDLSLIDRYVAFDLLHVCAGMYAAKIFDPLRVRGIAAVFPYLSPQTLQMVAPIPWVQRSTATAPKSLLKNALKNHVAGEFVDRPKSGFFPPMRDILALPATRAFVEDIVLARENPLLTYVDVPVIRSMFQRAWRQAPLSVDVFHLLWGLMISSGWVAQLHTTLAARKP